MYLNSIDQPGDGIGGRRVAGVPSRSGHRSTGGSIDDSLLLGSSNINLVSHLERMQRKE